MCILLQNACGLFETFEDDSSTIFSGVILFSNDLKPAGNVEIRFVATENDFPIDNSVEVINFRTPIDTKDGAFYARFDQGLGIDQISITVSVLMKDGTSRSFAEPEDGLFCNGGPCFEFSPGVTYENLTILVPRIE